MGEFVQRRAIPVDAVEKGQRRGHLHVIGGRHIVGAVAADVEFDAGCRDHFVTHRGNPPHGQGLGITCQPFPQAFALRDVEHGKTLEKSDAARLAATLLGPLLFRFRREAVGIDHGHAFLAFLHIAPGFERLFEGEPALRRIVMLDDRAPEQQHIDPGIGPAGQGIAGHARCQSTRRCIRGGPWLNPWEAFCFKLGDDLGRDLIIEGIARFLRTRRCVPTPMACSFLHHGEGSFSVVRGKGYFGKGGGTAWLPARDIRLPDQIMRSGLGIIARSGQSLQASSGPSAFDFAEREGLRGPKSSRS